MKLKLTLLGIATILLAVIITLAIFIKPTSNGYYIYQGQKISGYRVYEKRMIGEVQCDSMYGYSIMYEDNNIYYTTDEVSFGGGCYAPYFIFDKGIKYSFNQALKEELITIENLKEFEFRVTIIEREKFQDSQDVIKVEYYTNTTDELDSRSIINNSVELTQISREFSYIMFSEKVTDNSDVLLYYLDFYTEQDVYTYAFYEDQIVELSTGKIASFSEYYSFPVGYLESYFIKSD